MERLRFRQIHLDFHTSELIPTIGRDFDKKHFQDMLKLGHVNSINIFAKCHHGWAYHNADVNEKHPNLDFELVNEMVKACHEIDVKCPIYVSAGLDEKYAKRNPEHMRKREGFTDERQKDFGRAGYHEPCMRTPYLDHFIDQVHEVCKNVNCVDGLWFDIVGERVCYCDSCKALAKDKGLNPENQFDMIEFGKETYKNYVTRVNEVVRSYYPTALVFHNNGHIPRGRKDLEGYVTQLEIESLPTGGWGYDHFPLSARYVQNSDKEYISMTGKFHTTWGEFGGFKHPNALRYEMALALAFGAKCCIGDQMHPYGRLDESTYTLIGEAYKEVEAKEEYCDDTVNIADIAIISTEAAQNFGYIPKEISKETVLNADIGALRILQENRYLFDIIDPTMDFSAYKLIVLPDLIFVDGELEEKLSIYAENGGKILATGSSNLKNDSKNFAIDLGAKYLGDNEFTPSYCRPKFDLKSLKSTAFVMYSPSKKIVATDSAEVIAYNEDSFFNREGTSFCSHQHTPNNPDSLSDGITVNKNGAYIPWQMFTDYAVKGELTYKEITAHVLELLVGNDVTLSSKAPVPTIVSARRQEKANREIIHIIYGTPLKRGNVEVIEDIPTITGIELCYNTSMAVAKAYDAVTKEPISYTKENETIFFKIDKLDCHKMIVME